MVKVEGLLYRFVGTLASRLAASATRSTRETGFARNLLGCLTRLALSLLGRPRWGTTRRGLLVLNGSHGDRSERNLSRTKTFRRRVFHLGGVVSRI
jgi:hypothetical protein